ncbi:MAG: DUF373 family protein [Thaumarchaeota archaeon]|nr:DUF373 family protein [Nitrososphaerota archaeon]
MAEETERYLILAVDRDGDLVSNTGLRSPVYGRQDVLAAATQLAISDPEEADANAMFAAVREYDRLSKRGVECEVAAVCGTKESGFDADRKVRRELDFLLKREEYVGLVLVSDGVEDELVIPVIQTMKPITSVVRIIVKHSRTVEETYLVLGRYLRMVPGAWKVPQDAYLRHALLEMGGRSPRGNSSPGGDTHPSQQGV